MSCQEEMSVKTWTMSKQVNKVQSCSTGTNKKTYPMLLLLDLQFPVLFNGLSMLFHQNFKPRRHHVILPLSLKIIWSVTTSRQFYFMVKLLKPNYLFFFLVTIISLIHTHMHTHTSKLFSLYPSIKHTNEFLSWNILNITKTKNIKK